MFLKTIFGARTSILGFGSARLGHLIARTVHVEATIATCLKKTKKNNCDLNLRK